MVSIRVPATSANLGPGFDCLGMALSLYDHFSFEEIESGLHFSGFEPQYQNQDNLVYQGYLAGLSHLNKAPRGLRIKADSKIPAGRGLGSSAACLVAGILAAFALSGQALDRERVFALASRLEGHPDNAAAAVFGGLRVSITQGADHFLSLPAPVHPAWRFLALVPTYDLLTKAARAVLPKTVPLSDAVFNLSRTALLLQALSQGDRLALAAACQDRLHQAQRFALIKDAATLQQRLLSLGADACFLSGAGPSLLCVYQQEGFLEKAQEQIPPAFPHHALMPLSLCEEGASVLFS